MQKQVKLCFHYAVVLICLWQPFLLEASQIFKEEHMAEDLSSLNLQSSSSLHAASAHPLDQSNDPFFLVKRNQQYLQATLLISLQARPDALSPLVAQMKETLASLSDASREVLKQKEAFILEPSLSTYSPYVFLRRKDELITENNLTPDHLSFKRLREVIIYLENLCENKVSLISPSLKVSLQQLKGVYESFIADLCTRRPEERTSLLSSILIDGEFFKDALVISQEQAYDFLSFDEYGIPFKNNLLGSSVVTKVGGIHAKSTLIKANQEGTLDPSMEWAVSTFHTMLFGEGMVPSSLLILKDVPHQKALPNTEAERLVNEAKMPQLSAQEKKKILNRLHEEEGLMSQFQKTTQSFAVQVTPHIEGIHLATFLEQALQDPSLWDTLDPYNVQSLLLTALITASNDAKGDNFMVIKEENKNEEGEIKIKHKIIGIDNDRAFYPYISASNPHNHYLDIFHILFFYPQVMCVPLIQSVKDKFLSYNPLSFLFNWLKAINIHNDKYQQLLDQGRLSHHMFDTLHLPFKLRSGSFSALLKRFLIVYEELTLKRTSNITGDDLLKTLSPLAALCFKVLPQKEPHEDLFHKVKDNNVETLIREELKNNTEFQKALREEQVDGTTLHIRNQTLEEVISEFEEEVNRISNDEIIKQEIEGEVLLSFFKNKKYIPTKVQSLLNLLNINKALNLLDVRGKITDIKGITLLQLNELRDTLLKKDKEFKLKTDSIDTEVIFETFSREHFYKITYENENNERIPIFNNIVIDSIRKSDNLKEVANFEELKEVIEILANLQKENKEPFKFSIRDHDQCCQIGLLYLKKSPILKGISFIQNLLGVNLTLASVPYFKNTDNEKAYEWFKKAGNDNGRALHNRGVMKLYGCAPHGRNIEKAKKLFCEAAKKGDVRSQNIVAKIQIQIMEKISSLLERY